MKLLSIRDLEQEKINRITTEMEMLKENLLTFEGTEEYAKEIERMVKKLQEMKKLV